MSKTIRTPISWYYDKYGDRDGKKGFKPNKKFKKLQKQSRKAKEKMALRMEKEVIPEFPRSDCWDFN
jgi:hypothetical protein